MFSPLKSLLLFSFILIILSQPQICFDYCAPNGCNCYKVLGVSTKAPVSEIRQIFRALSFQYHPDVNPGKDTAARFTEITNCYEILKNERSRAQYNDCMRYEQSTYVPKSKHDSLWSLAIPIISIILNQFRRQGGQQAGQPGQGGSTWKKILKGLGYLLIAVIVFFVLLYQAPFVLEPFIAAFQYVFYGIFGGDIFWFMIVGFWCFGLTKKAIGKIRSFLNKSSIEDEIKNFFTDLLKVIDINEERIAQETKDKRKAKEDGLNLAKNQELEILKRYHNDSLGFVGGKTENENNEENDDKRALLKSEKETELEKIYNRNVQLCESRHSEKLKETDEEFNRLIEKHKKAFESYRDFISKSEQDVDLKRKEKRISNEKLKDELQTVKKELVSKMLTVEPIENKVEENN